MSDNYVGRGPAPAILAPVTPSNGRLVQSPAHVRGDFFTAAGIIPFDNTIPQIGEGAEYFTLANFAPLFIGSRVRIRALVNVTQSAQLGCIGAFFRAGTADALAVGDVAPPADTEQQFSLEYEFIAGSLAPFTYSLRFGASAASSIRINGRAAPGLFNGTYNSFFRIDEYSP